MTRSSASDVYNSQIKCNAEFLRSLFSPLPIVSPTPSGSAHARLAIESTTFADAHPHPLHLGRSRLPRLDRRGGFHFRSFHPRPRTHPRTRGSQQRPTAERSRNLF